jgi:predicted ATPase
MNNRAEFQRLLAIRAAEREREAASAEADCVFLDRAVPDGIAYCRYYGIEVPARVDELSRLQRYDVAFVLDTLGVSLESREIGSDWSRDDSVRLGALLADVYRELGSRIVPIPAAPLATRINMVLGIVSRMRASGDSCEDRSHSRIRPE